VYYYWIYHNNPVLLEISTDCRGTTYPRGQVLEFRLYQSGRVEYDKYPPQTDSSSLQLSYWFPRKHSYIPAAQVNELIALAEQPDFLGAKHLYPPAQQGTDSEFRTSIFLNHAGHQKNIVVIDYMGDDGVGDEENYPPSLRGLLKRAFEMRRAL